MKKLPSIEQHEVEDVGWYLHRGGEEEVEVGVAAEVAGAEGEAVVGAGVDEPEEEHVEGVDAEVGGSEHVQDAGGHALLAPEIYFVLGTVVF